MAKSTSAALGLKLLVVALCATAAFVAVHAADPDPLQDFCVADLSANAPHVSGFPCKPRSAVTASDFVFTGLRHPGKLSFRSLRADGIEECDRVYLS